MTWLAQLSLKTEARLALIRMRKGSIILSRPTVLQLQIVIVSRRAKSILGYLETDWRDNLLIFFCVSSVSDEIRFIVVISSGCGEPGVAWHEAETGYNFLSGGFIALGSPAGCLDDFPSDEILSQAADIPFCCCCRALHAHRKLPFPLCATEELHQSWRSHFTWTDNALTLPAELTAHMLG